MYSGMRLDGDQIRDRLETRLDLNCGLSDMGSICYTQVAR
jgi:hypothetical protein